MDEKKRAENAALIWEYGSHVVKDGKSKIVPIRDAEELQNVFLQGIKRDANDGMWRQHSWCIYKTPMTVKIVETTVPMVAYFWYVLGETSTEEFEQRLW